MQMTDLMKRLAELDAKNPNIQQHTAESTAGVCQQCGMAGCKCAPGECTCTPKPGYPKKQRVAEDWKNIVIHASNGKEYDFSGEGSDGAVVVNGKQVGEWSRNLGNNSIHVTLSNPTRQFNTGQREPNTEVADQIETAMSGGEEGVAEGSYINGKKQSDDELVWKQTSLSMADAVAKFGKENVKIDGKNRLGEPIVAVKVPLVSKEGMEEGSTDSKYPHGEVKYCIVYRKSGEKVEGVKSFASKADAQQYAAKDPQYSVQAYKVKQGMEEGSYINGKKQSDDEPVWKQTSMSLAAAKEKYGDNNAKAEGKNRLGEPIVLVKVPLVSKEGMTESLEECGPMDSMSQYRSPASINMTAASGEELSGMLKDIMSLAGLHKVEPSHLGISTDASPASIDKPSGDVNAGPSDMRSLISTIDVLNSPDDEEETHETVDSMGADPLDVPTFDADQYAHQENQPGAGDTPDGERRSGFQPATFESLMSEYQKFLDEGFRTMARDRLDHSGVPDYSKSELIPGKFSVYSSHGDIVKSNFNSEEAAEEFVERMKKITPSAAMYYEIKAN